MNYSNNFFYWIRKVSRIVGITKFLHPFIYGKGYETKVGPALNSAVKTGDTCWDIGANLGLYTKDLSELVGKNGFVRAFEPHPKTFNNLKKIIKNVNTEIHNIGFGDSKEKVRFSDLEDHTINSIVDTSYTGRYLEVEITTIDKVIVEKNWEAPNIIKIDVEGFELDIMKGMNSTLYNKNLRFILIEIHHKIMENRKIKNGAHQIQKLLENAGFDISWIDPSHLIAKRKT
ncbi:FkbM family methyltransferase [Candidatus Pelagibacter sp.]|nr:FkbM family methyltransferase [Candidatus Pelagibacter sp.]